MSSDHIRKFFICLFVLVFFAYLFGPLIIMGLTAFNSAPFPRVSPWECFSVEWFDVLRQDAKLIEGLQNSLIIGLGVVLVSVPMGLAGALLLTQVRENVRPWYYTIVISPILIPGVVLGISTLLFWDRVGHMLGFTAESVFYNGYFLTIMGQSTFISAYTLLIFISRLQRFDPVLEEAALDLGATNLQTFRKVLLPFLKPALASAAVLAFLASFENYNTTVFTIISESTITTFLAAKVRHGINPSISALAVGIIILTVFGALFYEILKRREMAAGKVAQQMAKGEVIGRQKTKPLLFDPAVILLLLVFTSGIGSAYFAGTTGVHACKSDYLTEKKRITAEKIRKQQERVRKNNSLHPEPSGDETSSADTDKSDRQGTENFNSIFDIHNLQGQVGGADE